MYEDYFRLQGRPFLAAPSTSRYFRGHSVEQARTTLSRCIDRGEGAACIIGQPGTGKTLLCQLLAEEFASRFSVALLGGRLSSRQALFQAILYERRLPYRNLDEGELRLVLLDHLEPSSGGDEGLLLIVDEAHTLPWRLMEEVRLISNLVRGGQPRVRVVLAGGPLLEERFASPKLSAFSQRLSARCYLEPLDAIETAAFVRSQIEAVGGDPQLFDETALRSVFRATDGIGRLINQLCDHALILASLGGVRRLSSAVIDEAWADLQQLPAPWQSAEPRGQEGSIIEFGRLDEPHDEPSVPFRQASPRPAGPCAPDEQIDAIAGQLAAVEQDFAPLAASTTEIELDFPEFADPFSEQFAEEEIVLERFRNPSEIFAHAPRVISQEGKQLGPLLSPWITSGPWALPADVSSLAPFGLPVPPSQPEQPASQPSEVLPAADRGEPAVGAPIWTTGRQVMESVQSGVAQRSAVVVVEDAPAAEQPAAAALPPRVTRKGEFRGLFAKLRRG